MVRRQTNVCRAAKACLPGGKGMFLGSMGGADAISRDRCRYIALSRFRFLSRCVSLSFLISVATPFYIDFPVKNMYIYIYIYISFKTGSTPSEWCAAGALLPHPIAQQHFCWPSSATTWLCNIVHKAEPYPSQPFEYGWLGAGLPRVVFYHLGQAAKPVGLITNKHVACHITNLLRAACIRSRCLAG